MAGIYVHIPFCRQACVYCDFHFVTNFHRKGQMVEAIALEIALRQNYLGEQPIETLYFGGGTPSVLTPKELKHLFTAIHDHFKVEKDAEITLEANPEDLKSENLNAWRELGINRLSIGIQSFEEDQLQWMNRGHNYKQVASGIESARKLGFTNLTADLIFGLPGLDFTGWQRNLEKLVELNLPHLSIYALTVEPKTVLAHQVRKDQIRLPEDEEFQRQFLLAHERLIAAGYEHYELSNYARPGHRSRHNSAYWKGVPYLGLGPSAHSYDGKRRSWNWANNSRYLAAIAGNQLPVEDEETLSAQERYHEYIMTQLRKAEGIEPALIEAEWVPNWTERFSGIISEHKKRAILLADGGRLRLSPEGWMMSDRIIADFFLD